MNENKLRISQCMIVKDEEENIERALSWGKEMMWEQIVVDTGSSDRTAELARAMGAKVFHFDWVDDFAAAKNYAIEQASGDWIVFLDADEYMEPDGAEKLPDTVKKAIALDFELVPILCVQVGDSQVIDEAATQCRIFKNTPKIRYVNPIHEELLYNGSSIEGHVLDSVDLSVYHTGYQTEVMEKKKKMERNIRILLKELEKNPEDPNIMGYLGDSYKTSSVNRERNQEAERWYRKALPFILRSEKTSQRDVYTVTNLMNIICHRGAENEVIELYRMVSAHFPDIYDLDYLLGRFYTAGREYEKGAFYLERAFDGMEKYGTGSFNPLMPADIPDTLKALAVCYYGKHDLEKCVNTCVIMIKTDRTQIAALELLIRCFKEEDPAAVIGFLQNLYNIQNINDRILLLRGAISAGTDGAGILRILRQYCTPEELAVLDKGGAN